MELRHLTVTGAPPAGIHHRVNMIIYFTKSNTAADTMEREAAWEKTAARVNA